MTKFYGIGVGPGNPKMLSIQARDILQEIEIVFTPVSKKGKPSRALEIAKPYLPKDVQIIELYFPMHHSKDWHEHWEKNAKEISSYADGSKNMAMLTIGDPMIYSTFAYLLDYLDKNLLDIQVISGIPSFCGAAASTTQSIAQGDRSFAVLTEINTKEEILLMLEHFESLVFMKIAPYYNLLIDVIKEQDLASYCTWVTRATDEDEIIVKGIPNEKVGYLTILLLRKEK